MRAAEGRTLYIRDRGRVLTLDYAGALAAHPGESWFGVAVAFRALQAAGEALSVEALWAREALQVISGHPGDGVRDAVDYVTAAVRRGRYVAPAGATGCSRDMRFVWEVDDGQRTAVVTLRPDFVPDPFLDLLDRLGTASERESDHGDFAAAKRRLAEATWQENLPDLFRLQCAESALAGHA